LEFRGELPHRDACALRRLRAILGESVGSGARPDPTDREELVVHCAAVMRNYLLHRCIRRRFGFPEPFDSVTGDVARMEAATILQAGRIPLLREALRRMLGGIDPLEGCDWHVSLTFRRFLRMRAHQGLEREWMERHRGEARLLRCLRGALPRVPGLSLSMGARGRLITSAASDTTRAPIDRETLAAALRCGAPDFRPQRVGLVLLDILTPNGIHGGYCFMMDLVRAIHSLRSELLGADPDGTGATPASTPRGPTPTRAPGIAERVRAFLMEEAIGIDRIDLEKDLRRSDPRPAAVPPEVRMIRVRIAVEILLQEVGLADPGPERCGLQERLRLAIPAAAMNGNLRMHVHRTGYILVRLRHRLAKAGPTFLGNLW
jgi:hypothetical protein